MNSNQKMKSWMHSTFIVPGVFHFHHLNFMLHILRSFPHFGQNTCKIIKHKLTIK